MNKTPYYFVMFTHENRFINLFDLKGTIHVPDCVKEIDVYFKMGMESELDKMKYPAKLTTTLTKLLTTLNQPARELMDKTINAFGLAYPDKVLSLDLGGIKEKRNCFTVEDKIEINSLAH